MIFILVAIFQFKHFICDYPLQTKYMLGKFKPGWDFVLPLATHSAVHAWATYTIAGCFFIYKYAHIGGADDHLGFVWLVTGIDFVCHFAMDRVKASPKMLGRFKAMSSTQFTIIAECRKRGQDEKGFHTMERDNKYFWWALGIDQCWHHLTDLVIVYLLITH
jgi:hypothetical protein